MMWNQPPPKPRLELMSFALASAAINAAMPGLLRACETEPVLRRGLRCAHFHGAMTGDMVVTLTSLAAGAGVKVQR